MLKEVYVITTYMNHVKVRDSYPLREYPTKEAIIKEILEVGADSATVKTIYIME